MIYTNSMMPNLTVTLKKVSPGCCYKDWKLLFHDEEVDAFTLEKEGLCAPVPTPTPSPTPAPTPTPGSSPTPSRGSPTPSPTMSPGSPSWATLEYLHMYSIQHNEPDVRGFSVTMSGQMGF